MEFGTEVKFIDSQVNLIYIVVTLHGYQEQINHTYKKMHHLFLSNHPITPGISTGRK